MSTSPDVATFSDLDQIVQEVRVNRNPFALALAARGMDSLANARDDCARMLKRIRKCIDGHSRNQTKSCHQHCCEFCSRKRMEDWMERYQPAIEAIRATQTSIAHITAAVPGTWEDTPQCRADSRQLREQLSDGLSSMETRHGKRIFQIVMIDRIRQGRLILTAIAWCPQYFLPADQLKAAIAASGIVGRIDIQLVQSHRAEKCFRKLLDWKPPADPRENAVLEYLLHGTHQIQVRGKDVVEELFPSSSNTGMGNNSLEELAAATENHHHAPGTCPDCGKPFVKVSNWCAPGEQPTEWFDIPADIGAPPS